MTTSRSSPASAALSSPSKESAPMPAASASAKPIRTRSGSTKSASPPIATLATSERSTQRSCPTLSCSSADFPASLLALSETGAALTIREARSFLNFARSLGLRNPRLYCLKTSKVFSATTVADLTSQSRIAWQSWDISCNALHLTARLTPASAASACFSSGLFQQNVPAKYFLSSAAIRNCIRLAGRRKLPPYVVCAQDSRSVHCTNQQLLRMADACACLPRLSVSACRDCRMSGRMSDSQRYRLIGNAVTVDVVAHLLVRISCAYPRWFNPPEKAEVFK